MCNIIASQQFSEISTYSQPRRLATLFPFSDLVNRPIARYSEMADPRQMTSMTLSAYFARRIAFQVGNLKSPAEFACVLLTMLTSSKVCHRSFYRDLTAQRIRHIIRSTSRCRCGVLATAASAVLPWSPPPYDAICPWKA